MFFDKKSKYHDWTLLFYASDLKNVKVRYITFIYRYTIKLCFTNIIKINKYNSDNAENYRFVYV